MTLSSTAIVPLEIVYGLMLLSVLFGFVLLWLAQGLLERLRQGKLPGTALRWKAIGPNRRVLNGYEYAFYQALLPAATTLKLVVCPKLSLQQLAREKNGRPVKHAKAYRYLTSHTVDFAVCSARGEILMTFLLMNADGVTNENRIEAEEMYQVLKAIGIPLTRMDVRTKYSAAAIHDILSGL